MHFQVLPKQISTPRHIFLAECFGDNPLLFEVCNIFVLVRFAGCKLLAFACFHNYALVYCHCLPDLKIGWLQMLELVVKYRKSDEVLGCVEYIRVLLADNISRWHSAYRTRRDPSLPPPRVSISSLPVS